MLKDTHCTIEFHLWGKISDNMVKIELLSVFIDNELEFCCRSSCYVIDCFWKCSFSGC
jgi:hypothetical protein